MSLHLGARYSLGLIPVVRASANSAYFRSPRDREESPTFFNTEGFHLTPLHTWQMDCSTAFVYSIVRRDSSRLNI